MGLLKVLTLATLGWVLSLGASQAKPIHIVASFNILGDMVKNIAGDVKDIHVESLVKANQDPHLYEPTPSDAKTLAKADLIFILGLTFEDGWIKKLIKASDFKGKEIVVSRDIKNPRVLHSRGVKVMDPHVWHDVSLARTFIPIIRDALIAIDLEHKESYLRNAELYDQKLKALDKEVLAQFSKISKKERKIVTTHDAFHYLDHYGITVYSPLGISTDDEASAKEMIALIEQVKTENIRAIFLENMSNDKLVKQIGKEAFGHIKMDKMLYADTLSQSDGPAATYVDMIAHNTKTILEALRGTENDSRCSRSSNH